MLSALCKGFLWAEKNEHTKVCCMFNEPKRAHVTPFFVSLHWLPVAARIQFKTLMFAYRTTTSSAPSYFHSLLQIYIPSEVWDLLVSDTSWYYHRESQNNSSEHFRSPFLAGEMIFPPPSGMLDPCQPSSNNWKLISFNSTWLHPKKNKNNNNFPFSKSSSFSFSPSLASLYLFEQRLAVCLFKINRFMYSTIVSHFG